MPAAPAIQPSPVFPKATLIQLMQLCSGVQVVWTTAKRPMLGQRPLSEKAWLFVGVQSYQSVGVDELRQLYNATKDQNDDIQVGQRQFTMVLNALSNDPNLEALDLLERIRFRLRTQAARALMVPTLSLRDIQPIQMLPDQTVSSGEAKRVVLAANMDVRMNWVATADPLDPGEGNYIATVDFAAGSGTAGVTNGSTIVSFSAAQTLAAGTAITFASQAGAVYTIAASITGATSATLMAAYTGTTNAATAWGTGGIIPGTTQT